MIANEMCVSLTRLVCVERLHEPNIGHFVISDDFIFELFGLLDLSDTNLTFGLSSCILLFVTERNVFHWFPNKIRLSKQLVRTDSNKEFRNGMNEGDNIFD